ncbi:MULTISPECIES: hypothetical protein [Rhizobium]|uniref:hypothetical protein n=1 Tax=Rhizobium TaxID=379 RepID=UPI0010305D4D|nr:MULTISPECIES: hypothetical protein [Rhizobium]MDV4155422.1 hypothetical protein [Rhizobium brockwellii]QIO55611.1 hypothetical protein HA461_30890 [Rhizobium leguminosarum bv. trifolii]TAX24346.1 hypothetical protein ELI06_32440 [Rhizobium leguminosarum]
MSVRAIELSCYVGHAANGGGRLRKLSPGANFHQYRVAEFRFSFSKVLTYSAARLFWRAKDAVTFLDRCIISQIDSDLRNYASGADAEAC